MKMNTLQDYIDRLNQLNFKEMYHDREQQGRSVLSAPGTDRAIIQKYGMWTAGEDVEGGIGNVRRSPL